MFRSVDNPWLNRFAVLTAVATLVLIGVGGVVTSRGVGMSVPDWPTTYGYNMFLFPVSKWVGGILYEHSHRLAASAVGFMTVILAVWLWVKEARSWLRWLGVIALLSVMLQGVLGGLRVILFKDEIGIFHAALAQLFFVTVCAIALFTSRWWREVQAALKPVPDQKGLRRVILAGTIFIFAQLILGATMRHQHAGLAIPDFPLAYHKLWPPMDAASVASYNAHREEISALNPITAFQIGLQMAHRITAVLILITVAACAWLARRQLGPRNPVSKLALAWLALILTQAALGAATIWSNKAADIATAHVVVGALSLSAGSLLTIVSFRLLYPVRAVATTGSESSVNPIVTGSPAATHAK
jgi:cytochrome c oxidase assembly protein subunit 15